MCLHAVIEVLVAFPGEPVQVAAYCTRCDDVKLRPVTPADANLPLVGPSVVSVPDDGQTAIAA